jgi:hypothetical protein
MRWNPYHPRLIGNLSVEKWLVTECFKYPIKEFNPISIRINDLLVADSNVFVPISSQDLALVRVVILSVPFILAHVRPISCDHSPVSFSLHDSPPIAEENV